MLLGVANPPLRLLAHGDGRRHPRFLAGVGEVAAAEILLRERHHVRDAGAGEGLDEELHLDDAGLRPLHPHRLEALQLLRRQVGRAAHVAGNGQDLGEVRRKSDIVLHPVEEGAEAGKDLPRGAGGHGVQKVVAEFVERTAGDAVPIDDADGAEVLAEALGGPASHSFEVLFEGLHGFVL